MEVLPKAPPELGSARATLHPPAPLCARAGIGVAAALAGALSLVATRDGPGITQDSTNCLAMAASLLRDGSLVGVSGRPVTVFPPGFPMLLALTDRVGPGGSRSGDLVAVRLLLATCAVVTSWGAARIVVRHVADHRWAVVAAVATALSPALLLVWSRVWSEAPFIAALVVFLVAVDELWPRTDGSRTGPTARWLALAVASSWAAFLFRYVGVITVPVIGCAVALRPAATLRRRIGRGVAAASAASIAPLVVVTRNVVVDGTMAGGRAGSDHQLVQSLATGAGTVSDWVLPLVAPLGLVVVAVVLCWLGLRGSLRILQGVLRDLAPIVLTVGLLAVFVVLSDLSTSIDGFDHRILSGLVVPMVVIVTVTADRLRSGADQVTGRAVVAWSAVWLAIAVPVAAVSVAFPEPSLVTSERTTSELMAVGRRLPADAVVYSNRPEVLWMLSDLDVVRPMPTTRARGWEVADPDAALLRRDLACSEGTAVLVWFDDESWPGWISPDRLPADVRTDVIEQVADGSLLDVSLDVRNRSLCGG